MVEQIRRVRDDDSIKAIVLRVDSPGGSSIASDVIWRELMITRDTNPSRPLVVSMGDLAASGGYYISMPGQVIVAQPATLTGSIGIFTGKFVVNGTLQKLGDDARKRCSQGKNATVDSPFQPFSPEQRAKVQDYVQGFYDNFVEKVAESRRTTPERIDAVAQGRVWTGQQAKQNGLVDELGGLTDAIEIAKSRAKIPSDEEVEVVVYPARRSIYELLERAVRGGRLQRVEPADRRRGAQGARRADRAGAPVPARRAARADAVRVHAVAGCGLRAHGAPRASVRVGAGLQLTAALKLRPAEAGGHSIRTDHSTQRAG